MNIATRHVFTAAMALTVALAATGNVMGAAKKGADPSPSPSGSASAAPLPTATPEAPEVAIPRLEAKLKANPGDKDAMQQLAGFYLAQGKPDQALGLTQRLLAGGSKNAQVYYLDGVANQSLGRIKEATSDFEQASNVEPTNAQVLLTLTNLYLQTNRAADAERVAKRATTFNATDKRVFENYGLVLGQEGKFDEARTQFETAAKLDPKDPLPVVLQARAYVSQKAYALAGQVFDRALAIDPKFSDALVGRAGVQAVSHEVPAAIATYEQLLAVEPTDEAKAAVLIQEYQVYRDEKMNDQALAVLKRAVQDYGKVPGVHIAYGDYLVSVAKDQAGAEREWKTALGPSRNSPDALQRLGELAFAQNKKADGIGYFKRLTEVVPNDPSAWATLGGIYAQNNKFSDARDAFRHSFVLARTPQALAGLGTSDLQLRNFKECTQVFTAIDRAAPTFMKSNPQLLYAYGKCSAGNGDKAAARIAYTRFKSFVKPGTPLASEVDKAISSLGPVASPKRQAPKPKATH